MFREEVSREVEMRKDLKAVRCERCYGEGFHEKDPLDDTFHRRVECMDCLGSGFLVRKKCPECGEFSLHDGDAPDTCENCGYEKPAHERYRRAFPEKFKEEED